jgi:hypothetical protein
MLAGLAVLVALTVLLAPLYDRWYRHVTMPFHTDETIRRELRITTEKIMQKALVVP